jgi:hypothetical protein
MRYIADWDEFIKVHDLELRKMVAYWLNTNHYMHVDADDQYVKDLWSFDIYKYFKHKDLLGRYDPAIAPIHSFVFHSIKNAVIRFEWLKRKKKHLLTEPYDEEHTPTTTTTSSNTSRLQFKIDVEMFLNKVNGYSCMKQPCKIFKVLLETGSRAETANLLGIAPAQVSYAIKRLKVAYTAYQSGETGIEYWKREF